MIKPQSPCGDCERHEFGCRYGCEEYEDFRAKLDEYNAVIRAAKAKDRDPRPPKRTRKK